MRERINYKAMSLLAAMELMTDDIANRPCRGEPMKDHVDEIKVKKGRDGAWTATIYFTEVEE